MVSEVTAEIVVIATAAKATAMAAAKAVMAHRATGALTTPHLPMQQQLVIKTLRLLTKPRSMLSGLLTMLRTLLKIPTRHMVVLQLSIRSMHKPVQLPHLLLVPLQVMVNTMVKLMVRHSLLPPARDPYRHLLQISQATVRPLRHLRHLILPAMELRRHLHLLVARLQVVTVRFLHLPVCKSVKRL